MKLIRRLYLQWWITSNEAYTRCLELSGEDTKAFRLQTQALRVRLTLCR